MSISVNLHDFAITVCYRPIQVLKEKQHLVTSLLHQASYRVAQFDNQRLNIKKDDILWIMDNANWFPVVCRQLETTPLQERPFTVIWHTEPLPPPKSAGMPHPRLHFREIVKILLEHRQATDVYTNHSRLRALKEKKIPDLLVVSTPARQQFMEENGFDSTYVPLGYHCAEYGYDMGLARDIDVLFLGALVIPRRKKLLKTINREGIHLVIRGSWSDPALWGDERTQLLNRTRIFLNLPRYAGELSGARFLLGMANRAMVISEPVYEPGEYIPGKHYVSASPDEMPGIIDYYLTHDEERERIASAGHQLVTQELTMERSMNIILNLIEMRMKNR
jgi:hypothetical protein